MAFYDLSAEERKRHVEKISREMLADIEKGGTKKILRYFSDSDTYIRKSAYIAAGRIYSAHPALRKKIIRLLGELLQSDDFYIRQTAVNAAGEIAMKDFGAVEKFFDNSLFDPHHSVRNAVIGSIKKSGRKNPRPVLAWAKKFLHHPDKEVRREICHGIELRGRTHPQEILPLLAELQFDTTARVKNTLVHVIGQISYKKNCLPVVIPALSKWKNRELVAKAIEEIIDVHDRYRNFSALTQKEAIDFIHKNLV
ncbi:MAG TPA: HEAT repeat domain-containing protein [Bacteroidia bacterium]|nr:HEAT repeat domain-containing protein [Bacteroidia bacterium]